MKTDLYISVNNILVIKFCLAVEPTSDGGVRLSVSLEPVAAADAADACKRWSGLNCVCGTAAPRSAAGAGDCTTHRQRFHETG